MMMLPNSNAGVIILCNSNMGDFFGNEMGFTFIEMLYGKELTMIAQSHADFEGSYGQLEEQFAGLPAPEVDPAVVAPWLGAYEGGWALEQRDDQTLVDSSSAGMGIHAQPAFGKQYVCGGQW